MYDRMEKVNRYMRAREGFIMDKGMEIGKVEGKAEGIEIGQKHVLNQVVKKMKQSNMSAEQIRQITGLSVDEINEIC